jgi:hypothetical protein
VYARTAVVWAGTRLALAVLGLTGYGLLVAAGVVALVATVVLLDTRASREALLISNLGFSGGPLALRALALAGMLEGTSRLAAAALRAALGGGA